MVSVLLNVCALVLTEGQSPSTDADVTESRVLNPHPTPEANVSVAAPTSVQHVTESMIPANESIPVIPGNVINDTVNQTGQSVENVTEKVTAKVTSTEVPTTPEAPNTKQPVPSLVDVALCPELNINGNCSSSSSCAVDEDCGDDLCCFDGCALSCMSPVYMKAAIFPPDDVPHPGMHCIIASFAHTKSFYLHPRQ